MTELSKNAQMPQCDKTAVISRLNNLLESLEKDKQRFDNSTQTKQIEKYNYKLEGKIELCSELLVFINGL